VFLAVLDSWEVSLQALEVLNPDIVGFEVVLREIILLFRFKGFWGVIDCCFDFGGFSSVFCGLEVLGSGDDRLS